jgi:hypothetical protein
MKKAAADSSETLLRIYQITWWQFPEVHNVDTPMRTTNLTWNFQKLHIQVWTGPSFFSSTKTKLNSVALVRERTIPTERPPLVGEVSANFCG